MCHKLSAAMSSFSNFDILLCMCIALLEHHCGKHFPGIASALINKALVLMQQGNDIDAIASLKKAQRIHESICGNHAIIHECHNFNAFDRMYLIAMYS